MACPISFPKPLRQKFCRPLMNWAISLQWPHAHCAAVQVVWWLCWPPTWQTLQWPQFKLFGGFAGLQHGKPFNGLNSSCLVALLASNMANPSMASIAAAAEVALRKSGYRAVFRKREDLAVLCGGRALLDGGRLWFQLPGLSHACARSSTTCLSGYPSGAARFVSATGLPSVHRGVNLCPSPERLCNWAFWVHRSGLDQLARVVALM